MLWILGLKSSSVGGTNKHLFLLYFAYLCLGIHANTCQSNVLTISSNGIRQVLLRWEFWGLAICIWFQRLLWFLGTCSLVPEALALSKCRENGASGELWRCSWKVMEKLGCGEEQSGYMVAGKGRRGSFLEWKRLEQVVRLRRKSQENEVL